MIGEATLLKSHGTIATRPKFGLKVKVDKSPKKKVEKCFPILLL